MPPATPTPASRESRESPVPGGHDDRAEPLAQPLSLAALVKSDLHRHYPNGSWLNLARLVLLHRNSRVIFTLRLCQAAAAQARPVLRSVLLPPAVLLHQLARGLASCDLPWQVKAGAALRIDHGYSLVINRGSSVGSNVSMFHGVTLGRRDRVGADGSRSIGYPTIEDDVWIGPHAVIVGAITVGRGSRIGAGAFVTKDVPPASLVIGNPAKVVASGVPPDVMNRWTPEGS